MPRRGTRPPASPLGDEGILTTELKVVLVDMVDPTAVQQFLSCQGSDVRAQGVSGCDVSDIGTFAPVCGRHG